MNLTKKLVAEWIGTFSLVLFGCGSIRWFQYEGLHSSPLLISLAFGITIAVMITFFAKTSGAHFNPIVSFAFYKKEKLSTLEFLLFSSSQIVAGFAACSVLLQAFPGVESFGATVPQINALPSLFVETSLSFTLVMAILITTLFLNCNPLVSGIIIGGTVSLCSLLGGGLTGASMNPARTLGPNVFEGQPDVLWIYFFAPLAGAILAVGTFDLFFQGSKNYEENPLSL